MLTINIQKHLGSESLFDETGLTLLLHEPLSKGNSFILTSLGEGFSFTINGLYNYLDRLVNHFNFPKNKITIETWNLLEKHNEYNIKIKNEIFDCRYFSDPANIVYPKDNKIGVFLGRADFLRLSFHSKIQNSNIRDKFIYTFHQNCLTDPMPCGMFQFIDHGGSYNLIRKTTPVSDIKDIVTLPITPPENIFNLKNTYENIIFELVFETLYQEGFFITEKTLRPIYFGRPFLVIGPPNFEKNMEKLGFNLNFNFPFNINNFFGINKLNLSFDIINTWFNKIELLDWFKSIEPILIHNQKILKNYALNNGLIDLKIINQLN